MITTRSVSSYSKLYSVVMCVFVSVATLLEFVIGYNSVFLESDCYQDLTNYVATILVFNILACIIPLIGLCCTQYIILTSTMIFICGLFFLKSIWTFEAFIKYFNTGYKYVNRECHMSNIFYNQVGVVNIDMLLAIINILSMISMIFFLTCTKVYITKKYNLEKSYVTNNKTKFGEIKTDTFVEKSSCLNIPVVRTSDMDRILCFIIGTGMILIGTRHIICYTANNASSDASFYNNTVDSLETYALFSIAVHYMCGFLLLVLMFNRENICAEKIPGVICVFYTICMICGVSGNNTLINVFETYENKSEINLAYDIYSVAQFDTIAVFMMVIVPFAFVNYSSIYIIDTNSKSSNNNILTAELLNDCCSDVDVIEEAVIIENNC